jgi:hypothetical protein
MGKNTEFNHYTRVKDAATSFYFDVVRRQLTFQEYLDEKSKRIFDHPSYSKLTIRSKEFIHGYSEGMYRMIERLFIEWRLFDKEGNLVLTGHSAETLNYKFDYSACNERQAKGLPVGHHTWKGTDGKKIWS